MGAISYTDGMLKNLEESITHAIDTSKARSDSLLNTLQGFLDVVIANRAELAPEQVIAEPEETKEEPKAQESQEESEPEVTADLL